MSMIPHNLCTTSHSRITNLFSICTKTHLNTLRYHPSLPPEPFLKPSHLKSPHTHFQNKYNLRVRPVKAVESDGFVQSRVSVHSDFNFDTFLSILEFLCLSSSAVISVGLLANKLGILGTQKWLGSNVVLVLQCVVLVGGVAVGSLIRRRQWRRICVVDLSRAGAVSREVNLVERIEKLEEDLQSSTTIVRVLSRQLEKLGVRFRVTRKTLKDPIAEATTLAQKNSAATRALAVQGEILEKELGEVQKVLLAMQEQQQKQLELILAFGKAAKLWENNRGSSRDQRANDTANSPIDGVPQLLDQV